MTISWPPFGRWAAGYGTGEEALSWVPKSTIADKADYALPPGGTPQLAVRMERLHLRAGDDA